MAREGHLYKLHRRDWPGFLNRVIPTSVWQGLSQQVTLSSDPRIRWTPRFLVLCWTIIGWSIQRQLTERFDEGREVLARLFPRRRRPGRRYQGFTCATQRVGIDVLHRFWNLLRETIPRRVGKALWYWHNWVVMGVDGSRLNAPRTRSNEAALGLAGRDKTTPQWWVTVVTHLPTGLLWDWRQGRGDSSERTHLSEMINTLPKDALVVADAGFGGFDFLRGLTQAGVSFLVRCVGNTTLLVEGAHSRVKRQGDRSIVYLWPTGKRQKCPLQLRLIVRKHRGKAVYLLTNVMEPSRLSGAMAGEFYRARWGIEVTYRDLKATLEHRKLLSKTPKVGAMEVAGNLVALGLLMLHGALAMGAHVTKLSVAAVLRVLRRAIERVRYNVSSGTFRAQLRGALKDSYTRRRSKRARDWPHKKNEPRPGPPQLRTPSFKEKARIHAFEKALSKNFG
jgi:hypothetical protein